MSIILYKSRYDSVQRECTVPNCEHIDQDKCGISIYVNSNDSNIRFPVQINPESLPMGCQLKSIH